MGLDRLTIRSDRARRVHLRSRTARGEIIVLAGCVQRSPMMAGCGKGDYCDHGLGRVGGQVLTSQDEGAGPVNGGVSPPRRTFLRRSRVSFSSDLRRSAPVSVAVGVSRDKCGGLRASGRVSDRQLPQRVCRPGLPEPLEPARERIACGVRRSLGGRPEDPLGTGGVALTIRAGPLA